MSDQQNIVVVPFVQAITVAPVGITNINNSGTQQSDIEWFEVSIAGAQIVILARPPNALVSLLINGLWQQGKIGAIGPTVAIGNSYRLEIGDRIAISYTYD